MDKILSNSLGEAMVKEFSATHSLLAWVLNLGSEPNYRGFAKRGTALIKHDEGRASSPARCTGSSEIPARAQMWRAEF